MINSSKKHLENARESYFEHMFFALKISINLILGGLMALIHSIVPGIFTKNASTIILKLSDQIKERKKNN